MREFPGYGCYVYYFAPKDANDAANGVDEAAKPVVLFEENFESVLVK